MLHLARLASTTQPARRLVSYNWASRLFPNTAPTVRARVRHVEGRDDGFCFGLDTNAT